MKNVKFRHLSAHVLVFRFITSQISSALIITSFVGVQLKSQPLAREHTGARRKRKTFILPQTPSGVQTDKKTEVNLESPPSQAVCPRVMLNNGQNIFYRISWRPSEADLWPRGYKMSSFHIFRHLCTILSERILEFLQNMFRSHS